MHKGQSAKPSLLKREKHKTSNKPTRQSAHSSISTLSRSKPPTSSVRSKSLLVNSPSSQSSSQSIIQSRKQPFHISASNSPTIPSQPSKPSNPWTTTSVISRIGLKINITTQATPFSTQISSLATKSPHLSPFLRQKSQFATKKPKSEPDEPNVEDLEAEIRRLEAELGSLGVDPDILATTSPNHTTPPPSEPNRKPVKQETVKGVTEDDDSTTQADNKAADEPVALDENKRSPDGTTPKAKRATKAKMVELDEAGNPVIVEKAKRTRKAKAVASTDGAGETNAEGETAAEKKLVPTIVTIDALQGAKVKKNSAAAKRAQLSEAAAVAAQEAVESAQHSEIVTIPPPDTVVVNDYESAMRVLAILNRPDVKKKYHACDTETTGIDPKIQSPVGHGTVICASIYCGPDVDFGGGARIWIDNYGRASGTLDYFKEYFEDPEIKKVWHNYSFDRHIMYNHGINCIGFGGDTMHMARLWNSGRTAEGGNYGLESLTKDLVREIPGKESMTTRFGHKKILKNGEEGKVTVVPGTLELQLGTDTRTEWIDYSVRDAQATWYLRERLQHELDQWPWTGNFTMFEFYKRYWLPFGEMLTDMERNGIYVRRTDYLPELRLKAEKDRKECEDKFLEWAKKVNPACQYMNPSSEQQKQQLFFAPIDDKDVHKSGLEMSREFETENTWGYIEPGKEKAKKNFKFSLTGLGFPVLARTPLGKPQINIQVLKELAGNPFGKTPKYGKVYDLFGSGENGKEACEAIYQLVKLAGIEITISTFIDPLTVMPDQNNRVHCSLNLNTETGRLSARKPNLQNQPSMDKDIYKIRDAFAAEKGKKLIVADYGQLELRVLAHITKCKSMLEAFRLGGDFHSRTAMGMYKNIAQAVENGDVLLEWDYSKGDPPKPLLKDIYGNERKKAKILNFSIAYGKTARGLAADFGVSVQEAQETVNIWYADRPEVQQWQQRTISEARRTGVTRTLMGRYRPVHGINEGRPVARGHAERMAINTPIQGGAADIVMAGMLKLHRNQELRDLGYKILLQIHDELIVEGPEEHQQRALELVRECMCHPFKEDLLVELVVDANIANTWFEGK